MGHEYSLAQWSGAGVGGRTVLWGNQWLVQHSPIRIRGRWYSRGFRFVDGQYWGRGTPVLRSYFGVLLGGLNAERYGHVDPSGESPGAQIAGGARVDWQLTDR